MACIFLAFQVSDKQQLTKVFQKAIKGCKPGGCGKSCFGAWRRCREWEEIKAFVWFSRRNDFTAKTADGGLLSIPEWLNTEKSELYPEAFARHGTR